MDGSIAELFTAYRESTSTQAHILAELEKRGVAVDTDSGHIELLEHVSDSVAIEVRGYQLDRLRRVFFIFF